jgi:hypothetical protein
VQESLETSGRVHPEHLTAATDPASPRLATLYGCAIQQACGISNHSCYWLGSVSLIAEEVNRDEALSVRWLESSQDYTKKNCRKAATTKEGVLSVKHTNSLMMFDLNDSWCLSAVSQRQFIALSLVKLASRPTPAEYSGEHFITVLGTGFRFGQGGQNVKSPGCCDFIRLSM